MLDLKRCFLAFSSTSIYLELTRFGWPIKRPPKKALTHKAGIIKELISNCIITTWLRVELGRQLKNKKNVRNSRKFRVESPK